MPNFIQRLRAAFSSQPQGDYMNVDSEPVRPSSIRSPQRERKRSLTRFTSRAKKEEQLATLQAGYHEVVGVLGSIREHLEQDTKNQKKLLNYMEHIPEAVEGLKNVGQSAVQQSEVLQLVRTQLESNIDHDKQLVQSMSNFNDTLTLMDETSRTTSETITSLVDRSRESEDLLRTMLERSERRLVISIGVMAVVTLLVVLSAVYVTMGTRSASTAVATATGPVEQMGPLVIRTSIADIPAEKVDAIEDASAMEKPTVENKASVEPAEEVVTKRRGFLGFGRRSSK